MLVFENVTEADWGISVQNGEIRYQAMLKFGLLELGTDKFST